MSVSTAVSIQRLLVVAAAAAAAAAAAVVVVTGTSSSSSSSTHLSLQVVLNAVPKQCWAGCAAVSSVHLRACSWQRATAVRFAQHCNALQSTATVSSQTLWSTTTTYTAQCSASYTHTVLAQLTTSVRLKVSTAAMK
eukprot:11218-Heterococcus_DN1.PRE.3